MNSIGSGLKPERSGIAMELESQLMRRSTTRNIFREYTSASDDMSNGKTSAGGQSNKKEKTSGQKRFNMAKYSEVFGTDPYINSD